MISTRAPPYNIVLVDNINPDTGADTLNKIIIEPSIQFARKAPSSLQITLEPPPKTSDTPTSSGNLQRWSRALDNFSKSPRCWATIFLIIFKKNGNSANRGEHISRYMLGESS